MDYNVSKVKAVGPYCNVCEESFCPTEKELQKIHNSYSDDKLEEKLHTAWENARQDMYDHWTENHW